MSKAIPPDAAATIPRVAANTISIPAIFVPDGAEDQVPRATAVGRLGFGAVGITAAIVPDGAASPGPGYTDFGPVALQPDTEQPARPAFTRGDTPRPEQSLPDPEPFAEVSPLPRTRYRNRPQAAGSAAQPPGPHLAQRLRQGVQARPRVTTQQLVSAGIRAQESAKPGHGRSPVNPAQSFRLRRRLWSGSAAKPD